MKIDFGKLTQEQIKSIALEAMEELDDSQKIDVVKQVFRNVDDRRELIAQLED